MKRLVIILAAVSLMGLVAGRAWSISPEAQNKVVTAASKNVIQIGLSYRGDEIHFFGVNPVPGADVITRLTAEKEEVIKLSMKGKVGPFWMTVKQYEVTGAPFIYKIHANKPIGEIISEETARELEIGYPAIKNRMKMHLVRGQAAPGDADKVFEGLVNIKESDNLYNIVEDPRRLEIEEGKLFKHYFRFPPKATEGSYQVETFAFQNGELVGYGKDVIEIKKVGLESWLTKTSQESPVFYGIMAVLIAMGAGLGVGMIFRKGGHH
ncbi:MAG: TIGR02186 family protein [Deltaproteobacteria bacterium]|nr:TIGR02186 family protein [Deltaproteobacteria bacterium]